MDRNKKQNSVRYNCQVRDINKKSVSNTASTWHLFCHESCLDSRLRLPFYATFAPTLPRYTLRQRHKCRLSECWTDAARPFNERRNIRLSSGAQRRPTRELSWRRSSESLTAFLLLAAYPPLVRPMPFGTINCNFEKLGAFWEIKASPQKLIA